jgi:hypothetical protein
MDSVKNNSSLQTNKIFEPEWLCRSIRDEKLVCLEREIKKDYVLKALQ